VHLLEPVLGAGAELALQARDPLAAGRRIDLEDVGRLLGAQALAVDQVEEFALLVGDVPEAGLEGLEAVDLVLFLARVVAEQLLADQLVHVASVAVLAPVVFHQLAAGDRQQPRPRAGAGAVLFALRPGLDKGVLGELVAEFLVGGIAQHRPPDQMVGRFDDLRVGVGIVVLAGLGHPGVQGFDVDHVMMIAGAPPRQGRSVQPPASTAETCATGGL